MAITIDGSPSPQLGKDLSTLVQLDWSAGGSSYVWTLLDKPRLSLASLSNSFIKNPTFIPDVYGSYHLKLVVDGTTTAFALVAVQNIKGLQRIPAAGEDDPSLGGALAGSRGWADDVERNLKQLSWASLRGMVQLCKNTSGSNISPGQVVTVVGITQEGSGLLEEDEFFEVELADATDRVTASMTGVAIGSVDPSTIEGIDDSAPAPSGEFFYVLFRGLYHGHDTSSASVGDYVYVSDTSGAISFLPGTYSYPIGRVVESSVSGAIELTPLFTPNQKTVIVKTAVTELLTTPEIEDTFLVHDTTVGPSTLTLPSMEDSDNGKVIRVQRIGANTLTLETDASDSFLPGGATTYSSFTDGQTRTFIYTRHNTSWCLIG